MNVVQYSDYADAVRFALTPRPRRGAEVEIVLDLYRGTAPLSQTVVARVDRGQADEVMRRCTRNLEQRGLRAASSPAKAKMEATRVDPRLSLSVAAFDWMFEAS